MVHSYINTGRWNDPTTLYPTGSNMLSGPGVNHDVTEGDNGLFIRADTQNLLSQFDQQVTEDPTSITVGGLQYWCQNSWKKPHGTYESAVRFGAKLVEEHEEFGVALLNYDRCNPQDKNAARKEILSEAGDVLFCLMALASNATIRVEAAVQDLLYKMSVSVVVLDHSTGERRHPVWRDQAVKLALQNLQPVNMSDMDDLFSARFMPEFIIPKNIEPSDEDTPSIREIVQDWGHTAFYATILQHRAEDQYGGEERQYVTAESYDRLRCEMRPAIAATVLQLGYALHNSCGGTFAEVLPILHKKITGRVEAGLLDDKVNRPDDLR